MTLNKKQILNEYSIDISRSLSSCLVILKPDFPLIEKRPFLNFCAEKELKIIFRKKLILNKYQVIALYQDIFNSLPGDTIFGIGWKYDLIKYLTKSHSEIFLIEGKDAIKILNDYKIGIRTKYRKITKPKEALDEKTFNEKVIKNLIHVSDRGDQLISFWALVV